MINTIINGDCFVEVPKLMNKGILVDMVLIDPPYGISRETNFHTLHAHRGTSMNFGEWDKDVDITSHIKLIPEVLKEGGNVVIFNAWENLGDIAREMRINGLEPKRCLVLQKSNPQPFNRDRMFVNSIEFAVWGVKKSKKHKWTFNRELPLEFCTIPTTVQSKKHHETMKDIKVISKLVRLLSNEGDLILDYFAGSCTTGLACKNLNRRFICIEKEERYCLTGKERLGI